MPILSQFTAKAHSQTTKRRVRGCFKKRRKPNEVGVIHMNGRIYDPLIGRFMSADPFIQAPFELQSHNRYAYVMNNPLGYTDPSGYFLKWVSDQVHNVSNTATNILQPLEGAAKVGVVFAAAYYTGQWAMAAGYGAVGAGAIGGFAGGFAGSAINGGNLEQSIKGGLIGGATGAAFGYVGGSYAAGTTGSYVGHGVVGCVSSVAGGGKCSSGAAAAVFGKWATNSIGGTPGKFDAYQFAATAVAGGVGSVIGGGKFLNGATTAAYGYLFNHLMHPRPMAPLAGKPIGCASCNAQNEGYVPELGVTTGTPPMALPDISNVRLPGFLGIVQSWADYIFNSTADDAAQLGYDRIAKDPPMNSHGQKVYTDGNRFISPDADGHKGGVWKLFDRHGRRLGTFDCNVQSPPSRTSKGIEREPVKITSAQTQKIPAHKTAGIFSSLR